MTNNQNLDSATELAREIDQLLKKHEDINLKLHGRPDCKSCSLAEELSVVLALIKGGNNDE